MPQLLDNLEVFEVVLDLVAGDNLRNHHGVEVGLVMVDILLRSHLRHLNLRDQIFEVLDHPGCFRLQLRQTTYKLVLLDSRHLAHHINPLSDAVLTILCERNGRLTV